MSPFSRTLGRIVFYRLPVIIFCTLIFWQSSYPGVVSGSSFPHADKVLHFGGYAFLAILTAISLKEGKPFWSPLKIKIVTILFACFYGLSDEVHQAFVAARSASVYDFIADCAGSILGCLFYMKFLSRHK
ncbi:VanZ family protein [Desulfobacula toluolica]|uniref:VanZ family protein n=1 Tax=Desulfobacula toluolica TaxID=28223 RepID=UPI0002FD6F55|nr:VanZ family protein [Desulfobacula toluolica]